MTKAAVTAFVAALLALTSPLARAQDAPQPRTELVLQTGHTDPVNALALSPDNQEIGRIAGLHVQANVVVVGCPCDFDDAVIQNRRRREQSPRFEVLQHVAVLPPQG